MLEVDKDKLISGKEYYIEALRIDRGSRIYRIIAKFIEFKLVHGHIQYCFSNFRDIKYKKNKKYGRDVVLNRCWIFYEIIENKIQKDIEKRAWNIILEKIVKDQYFFSTFL